MTTTRKKSSVSSYGTVSCEEDADDVAKNNVDLESQNRSIVPSSDTSTKGKKIALLAFSAAAVTLAVIFDSHCWWTGVFRKAAGEETTIAFAIPIAST